MTDLANTNAIIIVFAMDGCPACMDYTPRLVKQVEGFQKLGHPFVIYTNGMKLAPGQIPICIYDADSTDDSLVELANHHQVQNLPTTLFMSRRTGTHRQEGGLADTEIYQMLIAALENNR